jgi:serine/threonine protein kinase/tetratricopeptide (TPR) repeat protein
VTLSPGSRLGPYEILAPLGAGGMGEVYHARDTRLGREVAVKVLPAGLAADPDRVRRFADEARAASALNHPSILTIHDVGEADVPAGVRPVFYMVSELLEGESLRARLASGPLPPRKAIEYAVEIARGLAAAHEKGIVHRDLKPENLFLTRDGRSKILDFGLAKLARAERREGSQAETAAGTEPGVVLGTAGYMSPEQVRGLAADTRSDIFALGAVLYEMLTGQRAFRRDSPVETMNAILKEDPPPLGATLRDAPAGLERVVRRCLEKRPEERFQLARDLAFALEAVGEASQAVSLPPAGGRRGHGRIPSVAVLPFRDLSRDPENEHLGVGLTDATITELAVIKSLVVRPTSAVLRYRGGEVNPLDAGRDLGVDAVADGSFQRLGSRLRVTVQLLETSGGSALWGAKIDASMEDLFQMQDEVSRRIAEALKVELSPSEERRLELAARGGGEAYELYLRGKYELLRDTNLPGINAAIDLFEKSRQADPDFPLALLGLADAYARMSFSFDPEGDWHARAEEMLEKALALDPHLPEARYIRGRLLWSPRGGFDHARALREFLAAIDARPNLGPAHDWLGLVLTHVGLLEEAAQAYSRALEIDPDDPFAEVHLALVRFLQGRYAEALEVTERQLERVPAPWSEYQIAFCQLRLGSAEAAARAVERGSRRFPGDVLFLSLRGLLAALAGDRGRASEQIELVVRNRKSFGHYHHAQYDIGCIHALLGDKGEAIRWLEEAAANGFPCQPFFETDPLLEPLRGEERFARLLERLRVERNRHRELYERLRSSSSGS